MTFISKTRAALLSASIALVGLGATTVGASADSCWNHNGSIMRLKASGNQRWFYYENPKSQLRRAGVTPGTLLFNGRKNGNSYSGTARRFSRFCVGNPLEYSVGGPVSGDQLRVTLMGTYDEHQRCEPTGAVKSDRLVFTYAYDC